MLKSRIAAVLLTIAIFSQAESNATLIYDYSGTCVQDCLADGVFSGEGPISQINATLEINVPGIGSPWTVNDIVSLQIEFLPTTVVINPFQDFSDINTGLFGALALGDRPFLDFPEFYLFETSGSIESIPDLSFIIMTFLSNGLLEDISRPPELSNEFVFRQSFFAIGSTTCIEESQCVTGALGTWSLRNVPEPSISALLGIGVVCLTFLRRQRHRT